MKRLRLRGSILLALIVPAMITLGSTWLLSGWLAAGAAQELTVCAEGPPRCAYHTIQAAVDAASEGDVIKVAGGTYTDVHNRQAPVGYPDPPADGIIRQVVYISKSVTLRGGYSTAFSDPPDPVANPTTLDAQEGGRALCIIGEISPKIEGLRLSGGDAKGLGGNPWVGDAGGGVYVISAAATISNNQVFSNSAEYGGGLFLAHSGATIDGNTVSENSADKGGGLYMYRSDASLCGNSVVSNTADYGGGLLLWDSDASLDGNSVVSNTADWGGGLSLFNNTGALDGNTVSANSAESGGGLALFSSEAMLSGNTVSANSANYGGGLYLSGSPATLSGNTIVSNTGYWGGGVYLGGSAATLSGNAIFSNTASLGGGLYLSFAAARLNGNTISVNFAYGDGGGLYLTSSDAALGDNTISVNTAYSYGGGLYLTSSDATLRNNTISANSTQRHGGGGLCLSFSDAMLVNNVVSDNQAASVGSGLYIEFSSPRLLHTTIAHNGAADLTPGSGGDGSGVHITGFGAWLPRSSVTMTNTILVRHIVGITVTEGNTATLVGTLWGEDTWANGVAWGGAGTVITGTRNVTDSPGFVDPEHGDYHLGAESAAIDAGVEAGVRIDLDHEPRPYLAPDLGADEYWPPGELGFVYLPVVLRGLREVVASQITNATNRRMA